MNFLDRSEELARLERLRRSQGGGLAVIWGRRRIGKTRLLVEWCRRAGGIYAVFDQSTAEVQRAYVAEAVAARMPGFADVVYPDWRRLLEQLARAARAERFRGPIVLDELPYAVIAAPELPSVLQRWIDHQARDARLTVGLAGSSQRMMQGLVLDASAPLYGRAGESMAIGPLGPRYLRDAFGAMSAVDAIEAWCAWGGVPRYWELAAGTRGATRERIVRLVLDPLGPLHAEPERLLLEEVPGALEARPLLDAIGAGAHRVSEIAGRLGRPVTSLQRPLDRLVGMGLIRRETPFGEPERGGKRSLYRIGDPFVRLWFRVVAPQRAALVAGTPASRAALLASRFDALVAETWEDLCRQQLPRMRRSSRLGRRGPWQAGRRWWHGSEPEWDVVASSMDGASVIAGEARFSHTPFDARRLAREATDLMARALPEPLRDARTPVERVLFVPAVTSGASRRIGAVEIVTWADLSAH